MTSQTTVVPPLDSALPAEFERKAVNTIRMLAADGVQAANSGHPGMPMGMAQPAFTLWTRFMHYNPLNPDWANRDRFVLRAGHGSMLLYAMLHLTGYPLTLDDLKAFRQWGSATPGHPEAGETAGVEVTTGPLGQGFANAVGMAIAERILNDRFGDDLVDHSTFVVAGDGCFMEGVSHEAASLAGHLGLGKLVCVYDDNHITIDGDTALAYSDDVPGRFAAYGWHVEQLGEAAEDLDALEAGIRRAMAVTDRPSLVVLRSHIGYPSPDLTDDPHAHGNPFTAEHVTRTKAAMGIPDEPFWAPPSIVEHYRALAAERGTQAREAWEQRFGGAPAPA